MVMKYRQSSKAFFPLSLTLLLCGTSAIAINAGMAGAKPPSHAPAWGYRCRNGEQVQRGGNFDCDKIRNRGNQGRDRNRNDDFDNSDRSNLNTGILPTGSILNAQYVGGGRIIIRRNERYPLTLRITNDITDSSNRLLIPQGSTIEGEFQPVNGGFRFVARRLNLNNGQSYTINANSRVISSNNNLALGDLGGATLSDAAQIILGSILGNNRTIRGNTDLIAIDPGRNFPLTLRSNLRLR